MALTTSPFNKLPQNKSTTQLDKHIDSRRKTGFIFIFSLKTNYAYKILISQTLIEF